MNLTDLHMAMRFRTERKNTAPGRALADLRKRIAEETDTQGMPAARLDLVGREARRLMSIAIGDMPPSGDDIALMVDAIAFSIGETSRAAAWRAIGIKPRQGDDLISRHRERVDWPIWHCLICAAFGISPFYKPVDKG